MSGEHLLPRASGSNPRAGFGQSCGVVGVMAMSNILLLLGLLASVGSLVDARFYKGGVQDYTHHAYASTNQYVGGYSQAQISTSGYSDGASTYDYKRMYSESTSSTDAERSPSTYSERTPWSTYVEGTPSTYSERTPWSTFTEGTPSSNVEQTPSSLDWDVEERKEFASTEDDDDDNDDAVPPTAPALAVPPTAPEDDDAVPPTAPAPEDDDVVPPTAPAPAAPPTASAPAVPPTAPVAKGTKNPIDECWMHDPNWEKNRQALANCAIGFGKNAIGGAQGPIYVVTVESDDDLVNPKQGTLRYGVVQDGPLWIVFARNMTIKLQNELIITSFKTIDGRGFEIHITEGAGFTLQFVGNVIIHGIYMHDLKPMGPDVIRSNSTHSGHRQGSDGDGINIFGSHDVWVDHCYFARGQDGLVDAVMGSTFISVTNSFFEQHDKTMLFGAHPYDTMDDDMQVTVAYNHFAPGLVERVPRVRHGHAHIFNNYYASWGQYAIGGSEGPTILSEGNVFNAPDTRDKQVTKRIDDGDESFKNADQWNWQSRGDKFLNGAYFVAGGAQDPRLYSKAASHDQIMPVDSVPDITGGAGPLICLASTGGSC